MTLPQAAVVVILFCLVFLFGYYHGWNEGRREEREVWHERLNLHDASATLPGED